MTLFNHTYESPEIFEAYLQENAILNSDRVLIQLFLSNVNQKRAQEIVQTIHRLLPLASLIATTTAGVIGDGKIFDNTPTVAISVFQETTTRTLSYKNVTASHIAAELQTTINKRTKLAIIFTNAFTFNATELLNLLSQNHPTLIIAGGNAGDDFHFKQCHVMSNNAFDEDVVIALLDSDILEVQTKYQLNWKTIGSEFTVTKSQGATVYEINHQPALEIYRKYLGEEVASNPLVYGIDFPLMFSGTTIDIARDVIAFDKENGALTYAGDIPEGTKVKFGFANIQHIEEANHKELQQTFKYYNEGVYIYSCAARRQILGDVLSTEISHLNHIAPTTGFITYGEFFHDSIRCANSFLNITTTYVVLNEKTPTIPVVFPLEKVKKDMMAVRLKALTNFITQTGDELDESIHYLNQFKDCVNEATILSTTDQKGVITNVNQNFTAISGYESHELLGGYHSIIKHPDVPASFYKEMWEKITQNKMWKGKFKNRRKDGSAYYVLAEISPIFNKDGSFKEYLSIRIDITEQEEYRKLLEHNLDVTKATLQEQVHYTGQYEDAVNSSIAVIKTNTQNIITYANKKMVDISGYAHEELIGMHCSHFRHKKHQESGLCDSIRHRLSKKERIHKILINIDKEGNEYTVSNLFVPIIDLEGNVVEHLMLMHDITDVVKLTDEIRNTQKEVVFTLGAIGETRSLETGLHVKRVAEYSYLLAKLYGLSEEEAELLKDASPMHDIGKIGIPDAILNKPDKLNQEEFEIIKTHAKLGYEMLKHSKRALLQASAIVAHEHHEKWDGSGYPRGIKGEDIHIFGRITAIADVFDALGNDRVYKKAWDINKILTLFKEERGRHFDPTLIDLFMQNLDRFLEIKYTLK